jgi:hypothetical protein
MYNSLYALYKIKYRYALHVETEHFINSSKNKTIQYPCDLVITCNQVETIIKTPRLILEPQDTLQVFQTHCKNKLYSLDIATIPRDLLLVYTVKYNERFLLERKPNKTMVPFELKKCDRLALLYYIGYFNNMDLLAWLLQHGHKHACTSILSKMIDTSAGWIYAGICAHLCNTNNTLHTPDDFRKHINNHYTRHSPILALVFKRDQLKRKVPSIDFTPSLWVLAERGLLNNNISKQIKASMTTIEDYVFFYLCLGGYGSELDYTPFYSSCRDYGLRGASLGGHLNLVKMFITKYKVLPRYGLEDACRGGHLHVLKYLISQCKGLVGKMDLFEKAASYGHVHVMDYLLEGAQWDIAVFQRTLVIPARRGHYHAIEYILERKPKCLDYLLTRAKRDKNAHLIEFLANKYPCKDVSVNK